MIRSLAAPLFLALAACVESASPPETASANGADPELVAGGFTANELLLNEDANRVPVRVGQAPDSFFLYSYSIDGRLASIWPGELLSLTGRPSRPNNRTVNWIILCDPIGTARRRCRGILQPAGVGNNAGGLALEFDAGARLTSARVLGHDAPGRTARILVNGTQSFPTDEDGRVPTSLLQRLDRALVDAETILTHRYWGPSDKPQARSIRVLRSYGYAQRFLNWYLSGFKP